jgi:hypothetical protein
MAQMNWTFWLPIYNDKIYLFYLCFIYYHDRNLFVQLHPNQAL